MWSDLRWGDYIEENLVAERAVSVQPDEAAVRADERCCAHVACHIDIRVATADGNQENVVVVVRRPLVRVADRAVVRCATVAQAVVKLTEVHGETIADFRVWIKGAAA